MTPWQTLLTNLANIFKVKTIVTIAVVFTFCYLTVNGIAVGNEFVMIATAIITYYFAKDGKTPPESGNRNRKDGENE